MNTAAPKNPASILVVDDEPDLRTLYEMTLLREGYRVHAAGSVAEASGLLDQQDFDAVITDMRLPDGLGMELLRRIQNERRSERCIVMTAYGSADNAVEALKAGAFDYLTKPVDLKQFRSVVASALLQRTPPAAAPLVRSKIRDAIPIQSTKKPDAPVVAQLEGAGAAALACMVGQSAPMQQIKARIAKVSRGMAPVLVRGESGSGKELAARAVHGCSQRSDGPFVAVNCGAIPENLLESEFFGARKGSYTGATQDREGYFQAAAGGTLFLDEIGDLPLAMQSKLLRAIQERSVRAIGSTQEDMVDVRIVSATHKDLQAEVQAGRFRQDLFYRLNVIELAMPPLRERREDLPTLCAALLARIGRDSGLVVPSLSQGLLDQLGAHPLHGNVRELENLLHRAVALGDGDDLHLDQDGATRPATAVVDRVADVAAVTNNPAVVKTAEATARSGAPAAMPKDLQIYLDEQERDLLVRALEACNYNRTAAAARLGLTLRQIRYRIVRLGIAMPQGDEGDGTGAGNE